MQTIFLKIDKVALLLFVFLSSFLNAQTVKTKHIINWHTYTNHKSADIIFSKFTSFPEALFPKKGLKHLPYFQFVGDALSPVVHSVVVNPVQFQEVNQEELKQFIYADKSGVIKPEFEIGYERGLPKVIVTMVPVVFNPSKGVFEKITEFEIVIQYGTGARTAASFGKKPSYATASVLATGEWVKIGVVNTGVHAISKQYLRSVGVNPDAINPQTIKIYGHGAGMLPQKNSINRYDDLAQMAIFVDGEGDGVFNESDVVLFYGQSQKDVWRYNTSTGIFRHENNIYSDTTYYFFTYGGAAGKRIATSAPAGTATYQTSSGDIKYYYETDAVNLIKSGRIWLGEEFDKTLTKDFSLSFPSLIPSEPLRFTSSVVARSFSTSNFFVTVNNQSLITHSIPAISGKYDGAFASDADGLKSAIFNSGPQININYTFNQTSPGAVGWLDYFEITGRAQLSLSAPQLVFTDARTITPGRVSEFSIASSVPANIWDVTDPVNIANIPSSFANNVVKFSSRTDSLKTYTAFSGSLYFTPSSGQKMANQNLHALQPADLLIITHPQFMNEAAVLAEFHRNHSSLRVNVVNIQEIYNEFSSGSQDVSAIRDFVRMMYMRAPSAADKPKYLTLFGRASYDYKYRLAGNTNYIPTFASINSLDPVGSYNSDDYFGLLDDNEGKWESEIDANNEILDIAIGRLPAQDIAQASVMVSKIIKYATTGDLNDWRTKIVFVADDEDGGIHTSQADGLANYAIGNFKNYNVRKIFIDAYREELGTGGQRNPVAQQEIVRSVEQGALIVNYTGHGGEVGWAEERILNTDDINGWQNGLKLPLFVTATCEFSRFDDPARTSAGEMVLLNPNGGGIALFTTVRLVNSGSNLALNTAFYTRVGLDSASLLQPKAMGEILRLTKNDYIDLNTRNFALLGDPALKLSLPKAGMSTLTINSNAVGGVQDTIKALQNVTVTGQMKDFSGAPLTTFNGVIYPTIYDKATTYRTIGNNPTSPVLPFTMQNNVIYRGQASVKNGTFSFSFVVPKDIAYQIGNGKMSYYAQNGVYDAMGMFDRFLVGGTTDSIVSDENGPDIKVYLNDEKFVFGGITDENPLLIVKLNDQNGINITGKGIGRDISLNLNNQTDNTISLNDYYQGKIDDFTSGEVRFRLKNLAAGKNTLRVKAWDTHNNPSESMLDFVVASSEKMAIRQILNYPNPFTTFTTFHFDHNKAGLPLSVMIQIFTVSGKLLKTLESDVVNTGNHFDNLSWDGKDDYGDQIAKGVYVYKVKVKAGSGDTAEEFQKLVILN